MGEKTSVSRLGSAAMALCLNGDAGMSGTCIASPSWHVVRNRIYTRLPTRSKATKDIS